MEEYCWVITQAVVRPCCCRSGSSVLESGFTGLPYTYVLTLDRMYTEFQIASDLSERDYCVSRGVLVQEKPIFLSRMYEDSVTVECSVS